MSVNAQRNNLSLDAVEQYRDLVELSTIAIGVQSHNEILFLNKAGAELLGGSAAENAIGKSLVDFLIKDHHEIIKKALHNTEEGNPTVNIFETEVVFPDSTTINVELKLTPLKYLDKPSVYFTLYDIRKRKNMEKMLFKERQEWEDIFHTLTDMVTVHDKDYNIIYANKSALEILKIPSLANGNKVHKCFRHYHGTDSPPDGCPSCHCLNTGTPANFEIYEPHLKMHIEIRAIPRFDKNNNIIGVIHIARDITERKNIEDAIYRAKMDLQSRVEERTAKLRLINEKLQEEINERKAAVTALLRSEKEYRNLYNEFDTLLNGIPDNLLHLTRDLKIMWANKSAASMFGKPISAIKNQYCYSLCCNILSPCENCPTARSFHSGNEESAEIITIKGKVWDIRAFPIKNDSGEVLSVIELVRDITEKANLQADATRTRHLASLGELAAGVAHEINNPINNVINYAQILLDEFKNDGRDNDIANRIIRDGDRIATIVRSLLSFARIRKEEKSYINMAEIFSDTLALTSAQIRKDGINLKLNMPSNPFRLFVHPQQIQQVFLNIISNSRYALNEKYPGAHKNKTLEITCSETVFDSNQYARLVFRDSGNGISSDIIDKVMNPFFSTKPNRIGTGLGLSISHGIINEHNGIISVKSSEGEYTEITIELPIFPE